MTEPKHFPVTPADVVERKQDERHREICGDQLRPHPRQRVVQTPAPLEMNAGEDNGVGAENPRPDEPAPLSAGDGDERHRGAEDVVAGIEAVPERGDGVSGVEIQRRRISIVDQMTQPNRR